MQVEKHKFAICAVLILAAILLYAVVRNPAKSIPSATETNVAIDRAGSPVQPATNEVEKQKRSESPPAVAAPNPADAQTLSEIFANDDICALEKYVGRKREEKNARSYQAESEAYYFAASPFQETYTDYTIAISGMPGANGFHGRFLSALRMANWIEDGSKFEGLVDVPRAIDDLAGLALEDSGNAAAPTFALALAHSIGKPTDDLVTMIRNSNRFDTYQLDYLRSMADFDDSRVTSFLMRVSHHATLAIPNWGQFKIEFLKATEHDPEFRWFVTDLMMKQAKETKQPSFELGYNVMQTAMARSIAGGGRAYPSFKDVDAAFPQARRDDPSKFVDLLSQVANNSCDPKRVEKLRDYVRDLRAQNLRGGLAF